MKVERTAIIIVHHPGMHGYTQIGSGFSVNSTIYVRQGTRCLKVGFFLGFKPVSGKHSVVQIFSERIGFNPVGRFDMIDRGNTYRVPTYSESVGWSHFRRKAPLGTILMAKFHGHGHLMDDMWLLEGELPDVFSDLESARYAENTFKFGHGSVDALKRNILRRQKRHGAAKLCSYKQSSKLERVCSNGICDLFFRRSLCSLNPSALSYIFALFVSARGPNSFVRLHFDIQIQYTRKSKNVTTNIAYTSRDTQLSTDEMFKVLRNHELPMMGKGASLVRTAEFAVPKQVPLLDNF